MTALQFCLKHDLIVFYLPCHNHFLFQKKLSQHLAETVAKSANPLDLMTAMLKHYDSSLSPIEKQELQLSGACLINLLFKILN